MDKKYQIFISSTYKDLIEERNAVSKVILDLDHIPSGMELFPAADTEQFDYIKKVIDQCDYYALVLAGKYGSISPSGISYTEMEYEYAVETKKPILAFVHNDTSKLLAERVETDAEKKEKLESFTNKVKTGRLVRFWKNQDELAANVALSLTKAFSQFPQIGWVRANTVADEQAVRTINAKNEEIEKLRTEIAEIQKGASSVELTEVAGLDELFEYTVIHINNQLKMERISVRLKWRTIAISLQKQIMSGYGTLEKINDDLLALASGANSFRLTTAKIAEDDVLRVYFQMIAYGLIKKTANKIFRPTEDGAALLMNNMTVKKTAAKQ